MPAGEPSAPTPNPQPPTPPAPLTYLEFHLAFTVPPLVALAALQGRTREPWWPLGLLVAIAFAYTTPWDNLLVAWRVWTYPPGAVLATVYFVPVEEYAFFVIQTLMVGLWVRVLQVQWPAVEEAPPSRTARAVGAGVAAVCTGLGVWALVAGGRWLYLGLIVAWASPVIAMMWWIGGHIVWARRRVVAWAVVPITLYLWVADRVAIGLGIWDITDATRTGWEIVGLPVEEALFFFVTSLMVAQGLVMLEQPARADLARSYLPGSPDAAVAEPPAAA